MKRELLLTSATLALFSGIIMAEEAAPQQRSERQGAEYTAEKNQQELSAGAVLLRAFITNKEPVVLVKLKYTSETPFLREDGEKGAWALTVGEIVGGAYTDIPKGTKVLCEVPYFPSENKMEPYIIMSLVGYPSIKKVFDDENMIVLGGAPFYDVYGSSLSELIRSGFHVPDEWQKLNQSITGANSQP